MRIVWIGPDRDATFQATARAIATDDRIPRFEVRSLDSSPAGGSSDEIASADGVVLAVHHFEPRSSAWFATLEASVDPSRWRAALGPFATVAARAPFAALYAQGFQAANGPLAARLWLDSLTDSKSVRNRTPRRRMIVWSPSDDRSGIDADTFRDGNGGSYDVRPVSPRSFGLPFAPDVAVAWIPGDLNRQERVHLSQLRSATRTARWIHAYSSPVARARHATPSDVALVWPFKIDELSAAVEGHSTAIREEPLTPAA